MGIISLLQELKSISNNTKITDLPKDSRIAIDAHCWLHRGSYSCAREIVQNIPTSKYVDFFMNMIQILIDNGISSSKILIVFDGCPLPIKRITNQERDISRKKNIELAHQAELNFDCNLADNYYRQSVHITPSMVKNVINELKIRDIAFMVSPYESDAQLTFLATHGFVDYVITEDSDLIVYGCPHILFKLDRNGHCVAFNRCDLGRNLNMSFLNWTDKQFKLFCCLAGCDYLKNIRNIGIKKAYKLVSKCKTLPVIAQELRNTLMVTVNNNNNTNDSYLDKGAMNDYLHTLEKALATFTYQVVFNPCTLELQHLRSPLPPFAELFTFTNSASRTPLGVTFVGGAASANAINTTNVDFLGVLFDNDIATLLAKGDITAQQIVCVVDDESGALQMQLIDENVSSLKQNQQQCDDNDNDNNDGVVTDEYNINTHRIASNHDYCNNNEFDKYDCNSSNQTETDDFSGNNNNHINISSNHNNKDDVWAFESSNNNNEQIANDNIKIAAAITSSSSNKRLRSRISCGGSMLNPLSAAAEVLHDSSEPGKNYANGFETLYRRKRKQQSMLQQQQQQSQQYYQSGFTNIQQVQTDAHENHAHGNDENEDEEGGGEYFRQFEFPTNTCDMPSMAAVSDSDAINAVCAAADMIDYNNDNNTRIYNVNHNNVNVNHPHHNCDIADDNEEEEEEDWPVLPTILSNKNIHLNLFRTDADAAAVSKEATPYHRLFYQDNNENNANVNTINFEPYDDRDIFITRNRKHFR